MEELENKSNKELVEMMGNLSHNHDKSKVEVVTLLEILDKIEQQYKAIAEELKKRGVVE